MELINNKGENTMSKTELNFINNDDGIFLQVNDGKKDHWLEIMNEEEAENFITNNFCFRELEEIGGSLKLETDLVWVYVGENEEYFMTCKDNNLLYELGVFDEADTLMCEELEKLQ